MRLPLTKKQHQVALVQDKEVMKRAVRRTEVRRTSTATTDAVMRKEHWQSHRLGRWAGPVRPLGAEGMILPTILIVMLIITVAGLSLSTLVLAQLDRSTRGIVAANALLTAEAGIEESLVELNADANFDGFNEEVVFLNNEEQGYITYETTVTPGGLDNEKIITAIARAYESDESDSPILTRRVRVVTVGTSTTENYAVHSGVGGLIMNGSATISNGPVHVNGYLQMTGSARIGSASNPVNVSVGNIRCPLSPPYDSYPSLCPSSAGNPITANIWSNRIYGDVCATHQTLSSPDFTSHSGLMVGCEAEELPLPTYDREGQKTNVTTTYSSAQASCGGATTKSLPANLRITGNLNTGGSCSLTITGDIWIDGNFTTEGASRIYIAESLSSAPTIMVDGSNGVEIGASTRIIPNSSGVAARVITYHSNSDCRPDCTELTGTPLRNSKDIVTIRIRGAAQAPGSLFFAPWTKVLVEGSGTTGGTIGQTVELNGAGNIVFGTELSSGSSIWSIKTYQQVFE